MQVYIATLVIYCGIDLLNVWSINLQFALGGVPNFAYIVFVAVGAYVTGTTSLGAPLVGQSYILGAHLPFPVPLLCGALAGGVLAFVVGIFSLRSSLRRDYQAAVMFIVSIIATGVVTNAVSIFNGAQGIAGIPQPLSTSINVSLTGYNWLYGAWVWVLCIAGYFFFERLGRSNWGRALRAVRDQEAAAGSVGVNAVALRMQVFVIGGIVAGFAGGLLIDFIGAWAPSSWGYAETFVFFAALVVGGMENNRGAVIGTVLIPIIFTELPTFFPAIGYQGLTDFLQWIIVGIIWIAFIGLRPQGVLPGKRLLVDRDRPEGWRSIHGLRGGRRRAVTSGVLEAGRPLEPVGVAQGMDFARGGDRIGG